MYLKSIIKSADFRVTSRKPAEDGIPYNSGGCSRRQAARVKPLGDFSSASQGCCSRRSSRFCTADFSALVTQQNRALKPSLEAEEPARFRLDGIDENAVEPGDRAPSTSVKIWSPITTVSFFEAPCGCAHAKATAQGFLPRDTKSILSACAKGRTRSGCCWTARCSGCRFARRTQSTAPTGRHVGIAVRCQRVVDIEDSRTHAACAKRFHGISVMRWYRS